MTFTAEPADGPGPEEQGMDAEDDGLGASPFEDEGMGGPSEGGSSFIDRLFDGGVPGPSVGELEADYGLSKSWSIFTRGVVRVATGSGIPPIAEITIGGVLAAKEASQAEDINEGAFSGQTPESVGHDG